MSVDSAGNGLFIRREFGRKLPRGGRHMAGNSSDCFRNSRRPIIGYAIRGSRGGRRGPREYAERGAHPVADFGRRRFSTPRGGAPVQHVSLKSCLVHYRGPGERSADELGREIRPGVPRSPTAAPQGDSAPIRARGRLANCDRGRSNAPKLVDEITVINGQVIITLLFWNEQYITLAVVEFILCPGQKIGRKLKRKRHSFFDRLLICPSAASINPYPSLCCMINQELPREHVTAFYNSVNFVVLISEGKQPERPRADGDGPREIPNGNPAYSFSEKNADRLTGRPLRVGHSSIPSLAYVGVS
jgi:hypothetical protein